MCQVAGAAHWPHLSRIDVFLNLMKMNDMHMCMMLHAHVHVHVHVVEVKTSEKCTYALCVRYHGALYCHIISMFFNEYLKYSAFYLY